MAVWRALAGGGAGLVGALAYAGLRQPPWLAGVLARHSRQVLFAVATTRRQVALTYDDGPHPELTPALLEVLGRHGARATFFFLGQRAAADPGLVRAVVAGGHEVGNHTWTDRPSVLPPAAEFERDVDRTHAALVAAGGRPVLLRPGSGWLRPAMLRAARRRGYRVVLGSVAVLDLRVSDLDAQVRFVLSRVRPGAVVVLHEGYGERAGVVWLTERLLSGLAGLGYEAVGLSELVGGGSAVER